MALAKRLEGLAPPKYMCCPNCAHRGVASVSGMRQAVQKEAGFLQENLGQSQSEEKHTSEYFSRHPEKIYCKAFLDTRDAWDSKDQ